MTDGIIASPPYLPPIFDDMNGLAIWICYSSFFSPPGRDGDRRALRQNAGALRAADPGAPVRGLQCGGGRLRGRRGASLRARRRGVRLGDPRGTRVRSAPEASRHLDEPGRADERLFVGRAERSATGRLNGWWSARRSSAFMRFTATRSLRGRPGGGCAPCSRSRPGRARCRRVVDIVQIMIEYTSLGGRVERAALPKLVAAPREQLFGGQARVGELERPARPGADPLPLGGGGRAREASGRPVARRYRTASALRGSPSGLRCVAPRSSLVSARRVMSRARLVGLRLGSRPSERVMP